MSRTEHEPEAADGRSRLTDGLCMELAPGWDFVPLHRKCPKCGCDLSKEFVPAEDDERSPNNIEGDANWPRVSGMPTNDSNGVNSGLQRMVGPLTKAKQKHTKRNERGWNRRKHLEKPRAGQDEYEDANNHEHLIPVIEGNFGKRIIQWLLRAKV